MSDALTLEAKRQKLREQIKSNPNDLDLHLQEGHLSLELGDIACAISAFSRAVQLDPTEPTAYVNRAHARLQRSEYSAAIEDYSAALRLNPADALTLNDLAVARQRLGDLDLALKDFQSAKALRPDLLAPRIGEGNVLLAKNEYAAAIAAYTRARDIGEASAIYWYRGRANLAADRWAEALRDFETIQRRGEGNHFLALDRGICLRKLGRLREAADVFSEILKDRPSDTEVLGQRGWALFRLGEFNRAKADYIRYLKIAPNDPRALFSLSLVYWQAGQLRIALDYMNRAQAAGHPGAGSSAAELEAQIRAFPPTSATTQPSATDSEDIASTGAETEPQVGAIGPSADRDENSPEFYLVRRRSLLRPSSHQTHYDRGSARFASWYPKGASCIFQA